jgi:hypothetical protein
VDAFAATWCEKLEYAEMQFERETRPGKKTTDWVFTTI